MRTTSRLLAAVQRGSQYLEPGAPTGLTGLATHASPRSTLLYLYKSTLDKLKEFPEHSVYRQSTEALTKHRMSVVEGVKPAGLSEWQSRMQSVVEKHPKAFQKVPVSSNGSEFNIVWKEQGPQPQEEQEDDVDFLSTRIDVEPPPQELTAEQKEAKARLDKAIAEATTPSIEPEPSLTVDQIGEIESKMNAGLIEEVIEVAQAEKQLADVMFENQVWEDLEQQPVDGQWTYYGRDRHTAGSGTGQ